MPLGARAALDEAAQPAFTLCTPALGTRVASHARYAHEHPATVEPRARDARPDQRAGLVDAFAPHAQRRAHALLAADFTAQQVYDHHEALMLHGQRCGFHASPACGRCPVLNECPFGQARVAAAAP